MAQPTNNGWFFVALGVVAIAVFSALAEVSQSLGPASIPIWGMAMGGIWLVSRSPIGHAIGRRISGDRAGEQDVLDVPQEVYAELDELRARVGELEERTDFTERLLARQSSERGTA